MNHEDHRESELESLLKQLQPSSDGLDPAVTFYRAGWEACRLQQPVRGSGSSVMRHSLRPFVVGVGLGIAAGFAIMLFLPRLVENRIGDRFDHRLADITDISDLTGPTKELTGSTANEAFGTHASANTSWKRSESDSMASVEPIVGERRFPLEEDLKNADFPWFAIGSLWSSSLLDGKFESLDWFQSSSSPMDVLDHAHFGGRPNETAVHDHGLVQGWKKFCSTLGLVDPKEWSQPIRLSPKNADSKKSIPAISPRVIRNRPSYEQLLREGLL